MKKLKKIKPTLEIHWANLWIKLLASTSSKNGLVSQKRNTPIIISMTSFPARFQFIHLTIESLLHQSTKPDKIILWLSKKEASLDSLPNKVKRLQKRGLTIRFVEENYKPYKKLIYTVQEFPDAHIITCDDDIIYRKDMIEGLVRTHKKYPNCIIANRCVQLERNKTGLKLYKELKIATNHTPSFSLLPTGVGGVLYFSNSLHPDLTNAALFTKLAPSNDDIWFKAMSLLNNTKIVLVNRKTDSTIPILDSQEEALWKENVDNGANDRQFNDVFSHYKLFDMIE